MAEKVLEFDVRVVQNRKFRVPYDKAIKLLKEEYDQEDCENWAECEVADYLYSCANEIAEYEDEDFYEYNYGRDYEITDAELVEE